ncbi:MAG: hypothetical protein IJK22_02820 [Bacteroidales bacterium]|nr:hypothetical protein [Bacteroidales bacterium]
MKKIMFIALVITTSLLISCANKSKKNDSQQSAEVEDTTIVENLEEERLAKEFLTSLYNDYVFGHQNFSKIKSHFSEKILNRLRNEFEYDGEGYAIWLFRTGTQDGPSNICQVNSIDKGENGWYTVSYTDMGYDGKCRFLIEIQDNDVFVLDFEQ